MNNLLPQLGIVQASAPATYLITPFQDGTRALQGFLGQITTTAHSMTYGTTLAPFFDTLIAWRQHRGPAWRGIFDHTQAMGTTERAQIQRLVDAGYVDGRDFVIGTSPEHHQINHLKAMWGDGEWVWHGSWNYSVSANAQYNSIEIVQSAELAALFQQAFDFAWDWIVAHEPQYQVFRAPAP